MSTIDVYKNTNNKKITEENLLLPKNYYGFSKMYNESTIKEKLKNTSISILRLPGVYGNGKNSIIDTFINRVFSKSEIYQSKKNQNKSNYFSKRFAAKEAFMKALGTGFRYNVNFKDISVINNKEGKPELKIINNIK